MLYLKTMLSSIKLLHNLCKTGVNGVAVGHRIGCRMASTDSPMAQLRRKTGYAFSLCRKALELHSQDIQKAEEWLRAEAVKQGWERAERVAQRPTADGLIGVWKAPDGRLAAMLELNCETDFVARNQLFGELAQNLTIGLAAKHLPTIAVQHSDSGALVSKISVSAEQLTGLAPHLVVDAIGKLGENIKISRGCVVSTGSTDSAISLIGYTHAVGGRVVASDQSVLLGKYGTIIALKAGKIVNELDEDVTKTGAEVEEIGKQLAQHIIGLNPQSIEVIPNKPVLEDSGESTALLKQQFIFDDDLTVSQYLNESNIKILDFVRFECGIYD